MFNFGIGEIALIAVILIIVVGPERLPTLMKTVGKTLRGVRQASRDIRASVGIDEMLREDFDLRRPPPRRPNPALPSTVSREQPTPEQPTPEQPAPDQTRSQDPAPEQQAAAPESSGGSPKAPRPLAAAPAATPAAAAPPARPGAIPRGPASAPPSPPPAAGSPDPGATRAPLPSDTDSGASSDEPHGRAPDGDGNAEGSA